MKIRKPKRGKAPKRPKASATVRSWENYDRRYNEWKKREGQKVADYNRKVTEKANEKRKKEALIKKYSSHKPLHFNLKVA